MLVDFTALMEFIHFNHRQLATRWNISEATLERWHSEGVGPEFMKLRGRLFHRQVDIEAREKSRLATSTRTVAAQARIPLQGTPGSIWRDWVVKACSVDSNKQIAEDACLPDTVLQQADLAADGLGVRCRRSPARTMPPCLATTRKYYRCL